MNAKQRIWVSVAGISLALLILVAAVWLIPPHAARAWALLATLLLPVAAWGGWWFGHTEQRGRLAGIDQAIDKVMGAASRTADLRVTGARAARQSPAASVVLPALEIFPRQLAPPGEDDVIEL